MSRSVARRIHLAIFTLLALEGVWISFTVFVRPQNPQLAPAVYHQPIWLLFAGFIVILQIIEFQRTTYPHSPLYSDSDRRKSNHQLIRAIPLLSIMPFLQAHTKQNRAIDFLLKGDLNQASNLLILSKCILFLGLGLTALLGYHVYKLHFEKPRANSSHPTKISPDTLAE